jgi:LuxR family maltose regulon positive regulatory protein
MRERIQHRLETKLHRPSLTDDFIARPRLLAALNRGLTCKLTLVSAPAGFGKSTLVSWWASTLRIPAGWVSLDEADNDLASFVNYLVGAVEKHFPDACANTHFILNGSQALSGDVLATTLINDLVGIGQPFVAVLDDYNVITNAAIHELVMRLVRHQPQGMHLVIVSRTDPPLSLARLRASNMLELRGADLRFDRDETRRFLAEDGLASLDDAALDVLEARMEGWAAGLRLAALSLRNTRDTAAILTGVEGASQHTMSYLLDEVLQQQSGLVQAFLLRTSILDRFCAELCEAVAGDGAPGLSGHAFTELLLQANLFVVPLDEQRRWFRYHHLFQQLLRHKLAERLNASAIAALHQRAGAWCANGGELGETLGYFLQAGDVVAAATALESCVPALLNAEAFNVLASALERLPPAVISARAGLLAAKAFVLIARGKDAAFQEILSLLEDRLADPQFQGVYPQAAARQNIRGQVAFHRMWDAFKRQDYERCIQSSEEALTILPISERYLRGSIMMGMGLSMCERGRAEVWERRLLAQIQQYDATDGFLARCYISLCLTYFRAARYAEMKLAAQRLLEIAQQSDLLVSQGFGHCLLGMAHHALHEIEEAIQHLTFVHERRYALTTVVVPTAVQLLIKAYQAVGRREDAAFTFEQLAKYDLDTVGAITPATHAVGAQLALLPTPGQPEPNRSTARASAAPANGWNGIAPEDLLTPRETEILRLVDQQLSNKEVAQRLFITPETAQRHVSNLMLKLDVHNRRQAVRKAKSLGIL